MRLRQTIGFSLVLLVMSGGAMAKTAAHDTSERHPTAKKHLAETRSKSARAADHRRRSHARPEAQVTAERYSSSRHGSPHPIARLHPIGPVHAVGAVEVGSAAWYGGRHLGRRTASGQRLDKFRATAAHRTLPLHSLARVTNLHNGRSCIVEVTDRGPASRRLLIDLSPGAADELDMRNDGIVPVSVEPVALIADAEKTQ
jgi:rare lipoprotein A